MSHDKDHSHHDAHDHSSHEGEQGKKHKCCGRHKHDDDHHKHGHHKHHEGGCGCRGGEEHSSEGGMRAKLADMARHHQDYTHDLLLLIRKADEKGNTAVSTDLKTALEHSMVVDSALQSAVDKLV